MPASSSADRGGSLAVDGFDDVAACREFTHFRRKILAAPVYK
jgi:hypothetical protein